MAEIVATVEISMYPLHENYLNLIQSFIDKLQDYTDLRTTTGPTSTVIIGEYERVMACVTQILRWSYEEHGPSVFVAKFLPGYEPE